MTREQRARIAVESRERARSENAGAIADPIAAIEQLMGSMFESAFLEENGREMIFGDDPWGDRDDDRDADQAPR